MIKHYFAMTAAAVLTACAFADKPATTGAELGKWTMDYPAALELAKTENKPVILNFTGSDWCGWCKLMDKNVFSQDAWKAYAKDAVVLVWLDFPRNKDLVPAEIAERNKTLADQYRVQGYPTYVILDPAGKQIGELSASKDATPEKFRDQLDTIFVGLELDKLLSAEDYAAYNQLKADEKALTEKVNAWREKMKAEAKVFEDEYVAIDEKVKALFEKAKAAKKAAK